MDYVPFLEQIRSLICQVFAEFGVPPGRKLREAVLIRDGYFCGRRFEADGFQAVWFSEEHQIKFYDRAGAVLRVIALTDQQFTSSLRNAA